MSCPCNLAVLQHLRRPWSSPPGCGDISWSSSNSFYNYYNNSTIVKCWKIFNCLNLSLICLCGGWTLSSLIECLAAQWHHEVSPSWPSSSSVIISIGARNRWFEMNVGHRIGFTVANESKPCQQCHPHGRKISQRHHRLNRLDLPERGPCQSHRPRPAPICTQWFFSVSCSRKDQKDVINETKNCVCVCSSSSSMVPPTAMNCINSRTTGFIWSPSGYTRYKPRPGPWCPCLQYSDSVNLTKLSKMNLEIHIVMKHMERHWSCHAQISNAHNAKLFPPAQTEMQLFWCPVPPLQKARACWSCDNKHTCKTRRVWSETTSKVEEVNPV